MELEFRTVADLAAPGMPSAGPADFAAPHGAFLVGYVGPRGYRPIPDYNSNPLATWFGEKAL